MATDTADREQGAYQADGNRDRDQDMGASAALTRGRSLRRVVRRVPALSLSSTTHTCLRHSRLFCIVSLLALPTLATMSSKTAIDKDTKKKLEVSDRHPSSRPTLG